MSVEVRVTREVRIQMTDGRQAWAVCLQRNPDDSITVGMIYGDKDTFTHSTDLSDAEFKTVLEALA